MQLIWNGTGSAWATYFGNASAVLEAGGRRLLIDCGHTVPGRLRQLDLSLQDIEAVFISHLHGDHIYGLEEWGFRSFLQWKIRPHLLIAENLAPQLWKNVLSGTMAQVCDQKCTLKDYFDVTGLQVDRSFAFGPWELEIHPVRHVPNACAYGLKVRGEGAALGFTCDSLADADPWFYDDTRLVFHDCTFVPYFPDTVHAHFEQLRRYPRRFREKTYLVHYDDEVCTQRQDPAWQAALAASGMRLTEPFQPFHF